MSSRHYEGLWREGVAELVAHLDAEHPEDRAAAPKSLEDWARLYIRYVQTLRKLCAAHDGVAQPQKRACLRGTLDACAGRVLELRAWLAGLNSGVDVLGEALGEQLVALSLTPDALELPVPAYFREARAESLAARAEAAAAALAAAVAAGGTLPGEQGAEGAPGGAQAAEEEDSGEDEEEAEQGSQPAAAAPAGEAPQEQRSQQDVQTQPASGEQDGLQSAAISSPSQEEEARRAAAAVAIQAAGRGWLARRQVAAQRRAEMEFLGMLPPAGGGRSAELAGKLAAAAVERKQRQAARQAELDEGLVAIKAGVRQREGWAMKERIRDKLNDWFLASRNPETGEYADLPAADKGGSRDIIHPSPPQPTAEEAGAAAAKAGKAGAATGKGASSGKPGGGKGKAAAGKEAPKCSQAFLEGLRAAVQQYMDVWQEYEPCDPSAALQPLELEGMPVPKGTGLLDRYDEAMVTAEVRPVVHEEVRLEADDDMRRLIQGIKDLLKAEREGRKKKGGKGGKKGGKKGSNKEGGKGDGGKGDGGKKKAGAAAAGEKKGEAGGKGGKAAADGGEAPAKRKGKDLTAGRSIESIFAELAAAGLARSPAPATVDQFLGGDRLLKLADIPKAEPPPQQPIKSKTGGKKANAAAAGSKAATGSGGSKAASKAGKVGSSGKGGEAAGDGAEAGELKEYPEPSLAEARQAVVASCILPLGAHPALSKAPAPRTVLLYGPPSSGKSLLAVAVAHQAGASLFDLSPAATACKYAGKAAATMVHMVFKAARALAPSVVLLEDVDQVFISDKTRAKALAPPGGEPPNRIKKQLLAEVASLEPEDGVLVLCTSSQPQACVKKDERALRTFMQRYIQLPLPDYGGRLALLGAFAQREGLEASAHLSLLAQLSEGLSAGQLLAFVQQVAARMRGDAGATAGAAGRPAEPVLAAGSATEQQEQKQQALAPLVQAALELLPGFPPVKPEDAQTLREWTARVHSPLPPEEEPKEGDKKGGKAKKK